MGWRLRKTKEEFVKTFPDLLKENRNFVLTGYRGVNVRDITDLRDRMRKAGCEFKVIKNSLIKIVMKNLKLDDVIQYIDDPMAIVLEKEDSPIGAKILFDFSRKNEHVKIKGGYFNGDILDGAQVRQLAMLPSREVLISQIAAGVNAPITKFAVALKGIPRKLAGVLDAVSKKKK